MNTLNKNETMLQRLQLEIARLLETEVDAVDPDDSVLETGLDSMNMVRLAGALEPLVGAEIEPSMMYEYDDLHTLAEWLEGLREGSAQRGGLAERDRRRLFVAASFTVEPLTEFLNAWPDELGFQIDTEFAAYNQVFQVLLDPQSPLFSGDQHAALALVRVEDWFRHRSEGLSVETMVETVDGFVEAAKSAASRLNKPLLIGLCAHTPRQASGPLSLKGLTACDERIVAALSDVAGIELMDLRDLGDRYQVAAVRDDGRDRIGHIPYTDDYFAAMAWSISRRMATLAYNQSKVIVLDCDNTLWQGVAGEDGPRGVKVSREFAALQGFMRDQKEGGRLLCLASKNMEADVWSVFDSNPDMVLKREHIVASRINWDDKADNIVSLADELKLGLDSFVFVDDNPVERAAVALRLPDVTVVDLPADPASIPAFLEHHWAFDLNATTREDARRTEMYRANIAREGLRETNADYDDFLKALDLRVECAELDDAGVQRAAQLTQRTNQFNSTLIRRTEAEVAMLMRDGGARVITVSVTDRFGDYGTVGMMTARVAGDALICDAFMMSCRVLGKRVEQRMVRALADEAERAGLTEIVLVHRETERNLPLRRFFGGLTGSQDPVVDEGELCFSLDKLDEAIEASQIRPVTEASTMAKARAPSAIDRRQWSEGLNRIAALAGDVPAMINGLRSGNRQARPALATAYVTPRDTWQKQFASLWADILGLEKVGIHDDFFDLGGDSLRLAEMFVRAYEMGLPDAVSLGTTPNPTVALLAQVMADIKAGRVPNLENKQTSLEDEGQIPDDLEIAAVDLTTINSPQRILLTGATGYIGAHLVYELLTQSDATSLKCLVRDNDAASGLQRIRDNLERYGIWRDAFGDRLSVVIGDIAAPGFGMAEADFLALADQVDALFHCGAWVNFVLPYQHLRDANVVSVETCIRLAASRPEKPIQLHFVSTLGAIMSTGYPRGETVYEDAPLDHCEDLLNGYEQSKYVGDKMVWRAVHEHGLAASIYRPGMVSGLSTDGTYHKLDEFLACFLKGCIQLGSWPLVDSLWETAPVDFVTKGIVHIALNPDNLGHTYHSLHPETQRVEDHIRWYQEFGYDMRALPWPVWKREFLGQGMERLKSNALFPFVDFIRALSEPQVYFPETDRSNFMNGIAGLGLECPDQLVLLERYTKYFIDIGYIDAPRDVLPQAV